VLRDMTGPDGGFYSAEDADSEGVEGKFLRLDARRDEKILMTGSTPSVKAWRDRRWNWNTV